jgi:hypothetical protein
MLLDGDSLENIIEGIEQIFEFNTSCRTLQETFLCYVSKSNFENFENCVIWCELANKL